VLDQRIDVVGVVRIESDADRRLDTQREAVYDHRAFDRLAKPLDHLDDCGPLGFRRKQDAELVSPEAGDRVVRAQGVVETGRELFQQRIAGVVAERVVDLLEAVEVHHQHGDAAALALRRQDRLLDAVAEERAVREPGQRVVQRLVLVERRLTPQLLFGHFPLGDVFDHRDRVRRLPVDAAFEDDGEAEPDQLPRLAEAARLQPERVAFTRHQLLERRDEQVDVVGVEAFAEPQLAELLGRVAEHPLHRRVDLDVAAGEVGAGDPDRCAFEDRAEPCERVDLIALGLELGRVAQRRREHDREELERGQVVLRERVRAVREDLKCADDAVSVPERDDDEGADACTAGERGFDARVVVDVEAEGGLVVLDRPAGKAVPDAQPEVGPVGQVAAGRTDDELAALDQPDSRGSGARQLPCPLADEPHHRLQVEVGCGDVTLDLDDVPEPRGLLVQRLLGELPRGDVTRVAKGADHRASRIPQRHARSQAPGDGPVGPRLLLLQVEDGLAGLDDRDLRVVRLLRACRREEVEVRLAEQLVGLAPEEPGRRAGDLEETTLPVLEVDPVGRLGQEDGEQVPIRERVVSRDGLDRIDGCPSSEPRREATTATRHVGGKIGRFRASPFPLKWDVTCAETREFLPRSRLRGATRWRGCTREAPSGVSLDRAEPDHGDGVVVGDVAVVELA
jgi:hypothetical protein